MVRRVVGQFESCLGEPAWVGIRRARGVGRVRVFPCADHRDLVDDPQSMGDVDRAELAGRQVQHARALAGLRYERPGPVVDE